MEFFNKPKIPVRPIQKPKGCTIKVRKNVNGESISYSDGCSKEQIKAFHEGRKSEDINVDEED